MKSKLALLLALITPLAPLSARADYDDWAPVGETSYVYARVVGVTPIYRTVQVQIPRESCWNEDVRVYVEPRRYNEGASTVAGGAIGGLIGSQMARGRARIATGFTGLVLGAIAGNAIARSGNDRAYPIERIETVRRCRDVSEWRTERQIDGYWVDYTYRGGMHRTRLSYPPGREIRVRISLDPVAR